MPTVATALDGASPLGWLSALGLMHLLGRPSEWRIRIVWIPETRGAWLILPEDWTAGRIVSTALAELRLATPAFRPIEGGLDQRWDDFQRAAAAAIMEPAYGAVTRSDWLGAIVMPRATPEGSIRITPWNMLTAGQANFERAIAKAFSLVDEDMLRAAIVGPWEGSHTGISLRLEEPRSEAVTTVRRTSGTERLGMPGLTALAAVGISRLSALGTGGDGWGAPSSLASGWEASHRDRLPRSIEWAVPGTPTSPAAFRTIAQMDWSFLRFSPEMRADELRHTAERLGVMAVYQADLAFAGQYGYRSFGPVRASYALQRNALRAAHIIAGPDITAEAARRFDIAPRSIRRMIAGEIRVPDEVNTWAREQLDRIVADGAAG